jgi:hypothetical protein
MDVASQFIGFGKPRRQIILAGCFAIGVGCIFMAEAHAQSSRPDTPRAGEAEIYDPLEVPTRLDVAEQKLGSSAGYWKLPPQPYMREIYWRDVSGKELPADTLPFIRDSLVQIVGRTYYMTRDNFDGTRSRAWAGGGWIAYRSGLLADIFGVHAALYTSQKLQGLSDESGTKLLTPDQEPLNVLGQAYGLARIYDQEIRGGRQLVDTPLINPQDNRMVPNTFEAVQLVSLPIKDRMYDYAIGYLWDIKQRDSNDFISMSDALVGADVLNRGTPFGMVKFRPLPGLSAVLMDYYIEDFINTGFVQAEYNFQLPKGVPQWFIGANVIDQSSVGSDLLTGNAFQTYQASAKLQMSYAGWTAFVAGSMTGDESKIYSPYGTKPNYTDLQQASFDNAREKAFGGSLAYDFGTIGLSGLSVGAWYTKGWGAFDPSLKLNIPDRDELDLWLQYRPTEGPWKGFRFKVQYADLWQENNVRESQPEFRVIVDYTLLFRNP